MLVDSDSVKMHQIGAIKSPQHEGADGPVMDPATAKEPVF